MSASPSSLSALAPPVLEGVRLRLEGLSQAHAPAVIALADEADCAERTAFMIEPPPADAALRPVWIARKLAWPGRVYYACVDSASGRPQGFLSFMRDESAHRSVEIGDVLFGSAMRGAAGAEAVYLLLRFAFEEAGYRRVEWKCDTRNVASARAAVRFGFTYEGLFRQHMLIRGENRDTAWYAMLDGEWPARSAAFERWLAPDNFDGAGRQRIALRDLMPESEAPPA